MYVSGRKPCPGLKNILSGIHVTISDIAARRTDMGTNRQGFLDHLTALETFLRREAWVHSHNLMSSISSFGRKESEELSPSSITNRFGEMMVLDHSGDLQVLHGDTLIGLCIRFGNFEMEITALTGNLEMRLSRALGGFAFAMRAVLAMAHRTLLAPQGRGARTIETWVLNGVTLTIRQERLEPNVNADIGMFAESWLMFGIGLRLTNDERVPVPIGTQDQVYCFRSALKRTMQLDLEDMSYLFRDDEMFLVFVQIAIFAVLSQLDRMPTVRLLEAREANARNGMLLGGKKTFERLTQAVGKHLHGGGGNMFTLPLESTLKVIFARKRVLLLVLLLDRLKHAIIDDARLTQASHEQAGLFLLWVDPILKRFHVFYHTP